MVIVGLGLIVLSHAWSLRVVLKGGEVLSLRMGHCSQYVDNGLVIFHSFLSNLSVAFGGLTAPRGFLSR